MSPAGPPVPTPSPVPTYNPKADAERYTLLLWNHIGMRIVNLLKNHHLQHEPGGLDQIKLPLSALKDVQFSVAPADGDVLTYNSAWERWEAGEGGGGGIGQAFFEAAGTVTVGSVPGPLNMQGANLTVTRVVVTSNGEVSGNVTAGGDFDFGPGGGSEDNTVSYTWAHGSRLNVAVAAVVDATYLTVDVLFNK